MTITIMIMTIITVTHTHTKQNGPHASGPFLHGKPDQPARFAYNAVLR